MLNFILKPTSPGEVEHETTAGLLPGGLHVAWSTSHLAQGVLCYNHSVIAKGLDSLRGGSWRLEATTATHVTLAGASRLQ